MKWFPNPCTIARGENALKDKNIAGGMGEIVWLGSLLMTTDANIGALCTKRNSEGSGAAWNRCISCSSLVCHTVECTLRSYVCQMRGFFGTRLIGFYVFVAAVGLPELAMSYVLTTPGHKLPILQVVRVVRVVLFVKVFRDIQRFGTAIKQLLHAFPPVLLSLFMLCLLLMHVAAFLVEVPDFVSLRLVRLSHDVSIAAYISILSKASTEGGFWDLGAASQVLENAMSLLCVLCAIPLLRMLDRQQKLRWMTLSMFVCGQVFASSLELPPLWGMLPPMSNHDAAMLPKVFVALSASHYDDDNYLHMAVRSSRRDGFPTLVLQTKRIKHRRFKNLDKWMVLRKFLVKESLEWNRSGRASGKKNVRRGDFILGMDAFDTLSNGCKPFEVLRRFRSYGCDVLVHGDAHCFYPAMFHSLCAWYKKRNLVMFPGGGFLMGNATAILDLLHKPIHPYIIDNKIGEDQAYLGLLLQESMQYGRTNPGGHRVCLDTKGLIIKSFAHANLMGRQVKSIKYGMRPQPIDRLVAGRPTSPCFLHFAGPWYVKKYLEEMFASRLVRENGSRSQEDLFLERQGNRTRRWMRGMEKRMARGWGLESDQVVRKHFSLDPGPGGMWTIGFPSGHAFAEDPEPQMGWIALGMSLAEIVQWEAARARHEARGY
mmetsp:Transcript_97692/g.276345  ORF Transcript_97692/g.276345 Transcript_97692/m.276345 type:complete len:655 (+) Transcript_97692:152-2116(+)